MGRLVPELSRTADLRLAQFRMADDEPQALALAQTFVAAKLHNAVGLLTALRSNRRNSTRFGAGHRRTQGHGRYRIESD